MEQYSLVDAVEMNQDAVAHFKQQNPTRVRIFNGDKIFRDTEGTHKLNFDAELEVMGVQWTVSFPVLIDIYIKDGEDTLTIDVEAQDQESIVIENENGRVIHSNHKEAMEELGLTYEMIDAWATKYCLKG